MVCCLVGVVQSLRNLDQPVVFPFQQVQLVVVVVVAVVVVAIVDRWDWPITYVC